MKKIIFVFAIIFIANLGCKKMSDTDPLCACSPVKYPSLNLAIKNSAGADLLNSAINGSYTKNQIQLYYKDNDGSDKQINFAINPPISYGNGNEKFNYHQLVSAEITTLAVSLEKIFYLKLGTNEPIELNVLVNKNQAKIEKLLINKNEATIETGDVSKYIGSIFYLNL